MSSLLPEPKTLKDIALMYGLNKLFTLKRNLVGKSFPIDVYLDKLRTGGVISQGSPAFDRMNVHFLNRSMHQTNEACNKLWTTIELLYSAKSNRRLCTGFCEKFAQSSAVPTLHYANISAILSILSLFGLSSLALKEKRLTFYNVVRTQKGVAMLERSKYLSEVFGSVRSGWHAQVLQTYEELSKRGIDLPRIDLKSSSALLKERSRFHYDILGQTSMRDASGVDKYFEFLPTVTMSIDHAVSSIHQVLKPMPNRCDVRFEELVRRIPELKRAYNS